MTIGDYIPLEIKQWAEQKNRSSNQCLPINNTSNLSLLTYLCISIINLKHILTLNSLFRLVLRDTLASILTFIGLCLFILIVKIISRPNVYLVIFALTYNSMQKKLRIHSSIYPQITCPWGLPVNPHYHFRFAWSPVITSCYQSPVITPCHQSRLSSHNRRNHVFTI